MGKPGSTVTAAGTEFTYNVEASGDNYTESITASGPLTEEVIVEVSMCVLVLAIDNVNMSEHA